MGRLARGVKNFADDQVGFNGRETIVVVDLAANDGGEVAQRVVVGRAEFRGLFLLRRLAGAVDHGVIAQDGGNLAGAPVNLHIFDGERPVPRRLENGNGVGIGQNDVGFIVYVRVDIGFDLLRNSGNGFGRLAVHKPGHEIGAVATEIEKRAGAVELGIGEPVEKFGRHVDFVRTLVAVVNDDFADFAEVAFVDEIFGKGVACIPSSLVIHENVNFTGAREFRHAEGVVITDRQRLLHHEVDVCFGTGFDGVEVFESAGIADNALGRGVGKHFAGGSVVKIGT